jgi:hypothetical protein
MAVAVANKVKLMCAPGGAGIYSNQITSPLTTSGGLGIVFPLQPDVTYSQSVNYSPYDLTHTNYGFNAYRNTPSPSIQIAAQFASVTQEEAAYTLGCIHFLRMVTKMFFGKSDPYKGAPPPVLRFSAYGSQQFNNIRCVVANFATTYDSGVDLKDFGGQQVPVIQTIAIDLLVQNSPDRQKATSTKNNFISGAAYGQGFI